MGKSAGRCYHFLTNVEKKDPYFHIIFPTLHFSSHQGGVRVLTVVLLHQLGVWGVGGSLEGLTVRGEQLGTPKQ